MSDLSSVLQGLQFNPTKFDSVLNSHSNLVDNSCNIDQDLKCNCKYYDTNSILEEGVLHDNDFSLFHLNTRSLSKKPPMLLITYLS